jgi:hypothetical protein
MLGEGVRGCIGEFGQAVEVKVILMLGEGFRSGIGEFRQAGETNVTLMLGENFSSPATSFRTVAGVGGHAYRFRFADGDMSGRDAGAVG